MKKQQPGLFDDNTQTEDIIEKEDKKVLRSNLKISNCLHCHEPKIHASASQGYELLLEDNPKGQWVLDIQGNTRPTAYLFDGNHQVLQQGTIPGRKVSKKEPHYNSHFATCPHAEKWHKKSAI